MKKVIFILFLLVSVNTFSQRYELYTGMSANANEVLGNGYMGGFNFIMDMNQRDDREWANRMLFGFEHSGFYSGKILVSKEQNNINEVLNDCNCETTSYNFGSEEKVMRRFTRGVSLNFGIEVYKQFYLLTGVTNYNHITTLNRVKIGQYRTTYIDFGVKYYIKHNNWFFAPIIKFNPESTSFGLGVSWNHF